MENKTGRDIPVEKGNSRQIKLLKKLGKGSNGTVFLCNSKDHKEIAVKIQYLSPKVEHELKILSILATKNFKHMPKIFSTSIELRKKQEISLIEMERMWEPLGNNNIQRDLGYETIIN